MTRPTEGQRRLAVVSTIGHACLGAGMIGNLGAVASSPAWIVFAKVMPWWVWPSIFLLVASLAFLGIFYVRCLRLSMYLGSPAMVAWGAALVVAYLDGIGPVPMSAVWLWYLGYLKWTVADSGVRLDYLRESIVKITKEARSGQFGVPDRPADDGADGG